ncbi:MAG TPA: ferritin-like domain-containing protein [Terriglobales bacterium]|nr:ferritin-like domain-containing protein [Terriglobales bacterium]
MNKAELIQALNEDIADEFASAIQYINHASLISGARFVAVQAELLKHATEEMQHATTLAEQVAFLGGRPTVQVGPVKTSEGSEEMLREDLDGEKSAVAHYKVRIRSAMEIGEFGLARVLQDILVMEEEHVRDLQAAVEVRSASFPELITIAG